MAIRLNPSGKMEVSKSAWIKSWNVGGCQFDPPLLWFFQKFTFQSKSEVLFLWYISHVSWKFHWNSSSYSEDMKIFFLKISYFHQYLGFFGVSLLKKLWHQYTSAFFYFQSIWNSLTIVESFIDIRLVFLEI